MFTVLVINIIDDESLTAHSDTDCWAMSNGSVDTVAIFNQCCDNADTHLGAFLVSHMITCGGDLPPYTPSHCIPNPKEMTELGHLQSPR